MLIKIIKIENIFLINNQIKMVYKNYQMNNLMKKQISMPLILILLNKINSSLNKFNNKNTINNNQKTNSTNNNKLNCNQKMNSNKHTKHSLYNRKNNNYNSNNNSNSNNNNNNNNSS